MLPDTRYSLIARLASREHAASWDEFLKTYQTAIVRYCRSWGLQEADAVEVAQEVLLAVHQTAENWVPSGRIGSFRAWLFETARRASMKSIRQRSKYVNASSHILEAIEIDVEPAEAIARQEEEDRQRWLFYAAAGVVETDVENTTWQAFWQTAVECRSPDEVACELGISIGPLDTIETVRVALQIAQGLAAAHRQCAASRSTFAAISLVLVVSCTLAVLVSPPFESDSVYAMMQKISQDRPPSASTSNP